MPPSLRDWLRDGHLAWFVLDTIEQIDLGTVYADYRVDGHGRPAHDPGMMVELLLYAYAVGERSSRQVERRCREDVAFRVIAANRAPDHMTIARFRVRHELVRAELFIGVLASCAKAGMVRVGTVAVDGTKLATNAGLGANRCYPAIREEVERMLAEAAAADAADDELFGDARGDELPAELADPASRRARLERARAELEAEAAARRPRMRRAWRADRRTASRPDVPRGGAHPPHPTRSCWRPPSATSPIPTVGSCRPAARTCRPTTRKRSSVRDTSSSRPASRTPRTTATSS
jgi:transposase